jgi:hypothetical protein
MGCVCAQARTEREEIAKLQGVLISAARNPIRPSQRGRPFCLLLLTAAGTSMENSPNILKCHQNHQNSHTRYGMRVSRIDRPIGKRDRSSIKNNIYPPQEPRRIKRCKSERDTERKILFVLPVFEPVVTSRITIIGRIGQRKAYHSKANRQVSPKVKTISLAVAGTAMSVVVQDRYFKRRRIHYRVCGDGYGF